MIEIEEELDLDESSNITLIENFLIIRKFVLSLKDMKRSKALYEILLIQEEIKGWL